MAFPGLRKWVRTNKREDWRQSRANVFRPVFRPVVEQLECRQLPSTVFPISLANGGPSVTPNGDSFAESVSADGRYVAFQSNATNILPGQQDANGTGNI